MASHMLARHPGFSPWQPCAPEGLANNVVIFPSSPHVTGTGHECYLSSSIKALVWSAWLPFAISDHETQPCQLSLG